MNWSSIHSSTPAAEEEYDVHGQAIVAHHAAKPTDPPPAALRKVGSKKTRGPEFYKPFYLILMGYLFLYCSRIPELVPGLHLGWAIQPFLLIGLLMTGTTKTLWKSDIGRAMTAFTVWIAICVPFSTWKGGSFTTLLSTVQALALLFFMAALIRSVQDCFRAMYMVALGMAVIGVLSLVIGGGRVNDTRLGLGTGADTLADANFLALYLVLGIPFLIFAMSWKKGFTRVALFLMLIPVLAGFSRTGSRMGLLALAAGMFLFFAFASALERMSIVMGGILFIALAVTLLPPRITERFTTYLQASSAASAEAANSAVMRKQLFLRSLQLTFEHPVFGVGPGEFMDAEAIQAAQEGKRAMWHYTHNSYTELSSETGLPGLCIFLWAFYRGYKGLTPIRNRYRFSLVGRAALFLQIAVLMSCVGAFFLSIAYSGILYAILGIDLAFQAAVAREAKAAAAIKAKALEMQPEPQPAFA